KPISEHEHATKLAIPSIKADGVTFGLPGLRLLIEAVGKINAQALSQAAASDEDARTVNLACNPLPLVYLDATGIIQESFLLLGRFHQRLAQRMLRILFQ